MRVKEKSEKADLKLNILKTKIMASGPKTSWQIEGEKLGPVTFYFLGLQKTGHGDCGYEIKRCLLLGRKAMTNLESVLKSRDTALPTKVCIVKAMVFPAVMYRYELDQKEGWVLKNWDFQIVVLVKTLRVPWTARSNQSILKQINPEYSLKGLMLKL